MSEKSKRWVNDKIKALPEFLPEVSLNGDDWLFCMNTAQTPLKNSYICMEEEEAWRLVDYVMSIIFHYSPNLEEWNMESSIVESLKGRFSRREEQRKLSRDPACRCDAVCRDYQNPKNDNKVH